MFKELSGPIKEMIDHVLSRMNGEALGEDVARFYKSLVSNSVPEELAEKMTMKYLGGKLSVFAKIADKIGLTPGAPGKTPHVFPGTLYGEAPASPGTGEL